MEGKPIRSRFETGTRASVRVSQYLESWCIDKPFSNLRGRDMATKLLSVTVSKTSLIDLGDNCIQNVHLGRYIVSYLVGNFILR